eukprot:TRINITY_DN11628_c0_g1_i1.p1 TRINITY_DN11628_c0_g1~~TRINITY_DN11628_c0_g1_i1.p1  ORF type:complete len:194 (+),score=56.39 TRINITY_DN11628_c0_g1_i1:54-635(+)
MSSLSTLDEPISDTMLRDLQSIWRKVKIVTLPRDVTRDEMRELLDWDLWGPLVFCLCLTVILTVHSKGLGVDASVLFSAVFAIVSVGSAVVTLNAKLLGGTTSFFQACCTLGYCLFPLVVVGFLLTFLALLVHHSSVAYIIVKMLVCTAAWFWSTKASMKFIAGGVDEKRRMLAVYPIGLFFFFLAWLLAVSL